MTSISNHLDECGISPFNCLDDEGSKSRGIMNLMQHMTELKYVAYDSHRKQFELTGPGLKYLKEHAQDMKYLLAKYNITPTDYGELARFFPIGSDGDVFNRLGLDTHEVIGNSMKVDDTGEIVSNYDHIEFKDKAPGDIIL